MLALSAARFGAVAVSGAFLLAVACTGASECDGDYKPCGTVCCLECKNEATSSCNDNSNAGSASSGATSSSSGKTSGDAGHCQSTFETPCNGKCVRLISDVNNCGECGNVCKPDLAGRAASCFNSECQ